ncbi:MAG: hypothetical protein GF317_15835 [Candidatus Lokiarchaeota archaeon]|nr:hypothetical protein [Candidatus Lokiarchaeota archaeon]MBD3201021.1 hypothetical protein [Candidatus Lokiarchaeota archaeon]
MSDKNFVWAVQLDWLNVIKKLGFDSINEIPEYKREKALKNITKTFGTDTLLTLSPKELDTIVAEELKELLKKEINVKKNKRKKLEEEFKSKIIPLKQGGIIKINPNDLKDLDKDASPEEILKYFYKKFFEQKDKDDKDDERDRSREDNTGYYI